MKLLAALADPGIYTLVVDDHSPGVSVPTTVDRDPHSSSMRGSFTVGTPPPVPAIRRLAASVGPGARIAAGLAAGKAAIVVKDTSSDNFRLAGPGVSKATGVAFRGTATWGVTLRPGLHAFRSDRHGSLHGSFRVSA